MTGFITSSACQVQLYAMWTGRALKHVPAAIVERTRH
jgi:hypothetical protein